MYVPIHVCECCEGPFTIFILNIIVLFVIFFGIVKPIADTFRQEDNREKEEYEKWQSVPDSCPSKPWKYRRQYHGRLRLDPNTDTYHFEWAEHCKKKDNKD